MSYRVHRQHVDRESGMHVIELQNEAGQTHLLQIALGHESCPACGHLRARNSLPEPSAAIEAVREELEANERKIAEYAAKHGLQVK